MTKPRPFVFTVISAVLLFNSLRSQAQPASSASSAIGGMIFSSRAELVTVPVVVTKKKGKHIAGLKQSDFSIEENGRKRDVATFEEVTVPDEPKKSSYAPAFPLSNFASVGREPTLATIVVVDLLNTPFMAQANALEQLLKFLNAHLSGSGPIELTVLTTRGLRLIHSFTTDPGILTDALRQIKPDAGWPEQAVPHSLIDLSPTTPTIQSKIRWE